MGEACTEVFREAERLGGIPAKTRLAAIARVTSAEAAAMPDGPELLARLRSALDRLKVELSRRASGALAFEGVPQVEAAATATSSLVQAARLRRHVEAMVDLMSQRALLVGDIENAARRVDELTALVLGIARVSVWIRDDAGTQITCLDLFESKSHRHSAGAVLYARDHAAYFEALDLEMTIMASDALSDARTSSFGDAYLRPTGIGAMLDVPIWAVGRCVGVICHEHVGGTRAWTADEERFAYLMSNFLGLVMESSQKG